MVFIFYTIVAGMKNAVEEESTSFIFYFQAI